ncbi:MAG: DUF3039 domain-containing protein [Actinomycetota bacterium]|jgi:hypothetical protein
MMSHIAMSTQTADAVETRREHVPQTGEPECAHIVKTDGDESAAAKVLQARIEGTPLEALCGHRWVPSRDPKQLPLCAKCKDIYDTYRAFNDGLNESPSE